MDIRQLTYFLTIADMQNYSHAAKLLYVSQPALKQAISKMEEELHTQLFIYNNHHLQLTDSGQILYQRGKPLVNQFNQLVHDIQSHDVETRQVLTVGVNFLTMIQFMDQISRFIRRYPNVDLHIVQGGSIKLQHMLADNQIDVGIISFPQVEQSIIIDTFPVEESCYHGAIVMPETHPLAKLEKIKFKDLKGYNIVTLSTNFAVGEFTKRRCQEYGFSRQIIYTHDDFEMLLHSLGLLDAVAVLPIELKDATHIKGLHWIQLTDSQNLYRQGIAYRKASSDNAVIINQFIDSIRN
ncbi:LysR family transcriptional regulator [Lactobacillus gigeriorum]|uniref:Transcriptional regulator, LysR family n=1 Tax=Lactobacillus gigeriorum DSM 23908 = CRBIP 24.85 TaxID=1423751 RepID=I7J2R2_9LACO|nr:LysR family transcriptional regulator [Lactobacillus gigeriorum]KRN09990.1 hypothetical protein FC38_GL001235 [Lactobacillus gigeriorum DSM 23908 = CRBIP 24.85]CCI87017.1 Transcriptional regulator, LysR family [Lactobacillus gigeriorum DSM 23908 = CRBIP 24.85]